MEQERREREERERVEREERERQEQLERIRQQEEEELRRRQEEEARKRREEREREKAEEVVVSAQAAGVSSYLPLPPNPPAHSVLLQPFTLMSATDEIQDDALGIHPRELLSYRIINSITGTYCSVPFI